MPNKKKFISSTSLGHFITVVLIVGVFMAGLYLRIEMANKTVVHRSYRADAAEYILYTYNLAKKIRKLVSVWARRYGKSSQLI
jgi:hypothetical protein